MRPSPIMAAAQDAHGRSVALMKFLSAIAHSLGVAQHVYVVGGAVRNYLIDQPIKDIDVVVDSVALKGKDSAWFAERVQKAIPVRSNLTTNQYGVAILSVSESWLLDGYEMKGETIEIANARKESYGGAEGKGYKPHMVEPATIEEDLVRREFTFNTLLWRLSDLTHGPEHAEVLDLLGKGQEHLEKGELHTPADPDKTFSDDPTRMLRAIKFVAKYNFRVPPDLAEAIRRNAPKLAQMPWDAVRGILTNDILDAPNPRRSIVLLKEFGLADVLKHMLHAEPGMAAALGRSLNEHETHVLLDLLDLGWAMKTPISFLSREQQLRLRTILLENAEDPSFDKAFVEALKKPPVNQPKFFEDFAIPPKERATVTQLAREKLLAEPEIHKDPKKLEEELSRALGQRYPQTKQSSEADLTLRVVTRFIADKTATRPVWIDKKELASFVQDQLVPQVVRWLKHHPHPDKPIGAAENIAREKLSIDPADQRGAPLEVEVFVGSRPSNGAYAAVLGGKSTSERIVLEMNGALSPNDYLTETGMVARMQPLWSCRHETCLPYGLYSILIHEATHVADSVLKQKLFYSPSEVSKGGEETWAPYVNDPQEVRAFMQQIVDEAIKNVSHIRQHVEKDRNPNQALIRLALKLSTTWTLIEKHLTDRNKALILKAVYDRLDHEGLLFDTGPMAARVLARFLNAREVRILIDRDATLKARERFPAYDEAVIAEFDASVALYRIFDGEEMVRIIQSGKITGGTYAVKAERAHGASWGENISALILWGNRERGKRLGDDLFLAKLDALDQRFYHLSPKVPFDPNGPEKQPATMDASVCNAGLGCSIMNVSLNDVDLFLVKPDGQIQAMTPTEAKAYVEKRPQQDIELREVSRVYFQGHILGVDAIVVLDQDDGPHYHTWSVMTRDEKPYVLGAKTKEQAIEAAVKQIKSGGPSTHAPLDLLPKSKVKEWQRRHPAD